MANTGLNAVVSMPHAPFKYPSTVLVSAISKVYTALDKLGWLLHLALSKMRTMQSASFNIFNDTFAFFFGRVHLKRLQKLEKRFFILRKWHLLLSGALILRLVQKIWHRRANSIIVRDLRALMDAADTYAEWQKAARALDSVENRALPLQTSQVTGLQDRTTKLRRMQEIDDVHGLMWALRQDTSRNVGSLLSAAAEQGRVHCVIPPPAVSEYIEEIQSALHHICHCSTLPLDERMAFLKELRHALGRTGIALSGGGSFSHFHFGVSRALFSAGLLPRVLSGSSGGSIAAALLSTRTDSELQETMDMWPTAPNTDFFGPARGLKGTIRHLVSKGTLHSAEIYVLRLQRLMGDLTFQEAYAKSGRVLNIAVVAADTKEPCRVLNYLTAPNVLVYSAVLCSSAFPFLFAPQELLMKTASGEIVPHFVPFTPGKEEEKGNCSSCSFSSAAPAPGSSLVDTTSVVTSAAVALESSRTLRRWCDGSLEEDLPMRCLGELFGVNYFLVSQCNPWLIPVLSGAQLLPRRLAHLIELEVKHRSGQILSLFPRIKLMKLIAQPWYGDLNFILPVSTFNVARSAANFTPAEIVKAMRAGQRAVWSKLPAVRAACAVEVAVDAELRTLTMQARAVRRREEHAAALTNRVLIRASIPSWMDLKSLGLGTSNSSDSTDDIPGVRTARGSTDYLNNRVLPETTQREEPLPQEGIQQGSDDMEQLSEPWETAGLLLHRASGIGGDDTEVKKLEGGVDVWKDLTALTLGEDSLDFIAP